MRSTIDIGLVRWIWVRAVTEVRLGTYSLFLVTSCWRWRSPMVSELHLRRYGALVSLDTFILLLITSCRMRSTIGIGLARRIWGRNGTCVRLSTHYLFWLHHVEDEEHHWLVSCIWGRYVDLRKVRYSYPIFIYILWKVKSTIGYWVASEEGMVTYVRLGPL